MVEPSSSEPAATLQEIVDRRRKLGVRPDLVGLKAIANYLGVHRETIRRARLDGMPLVCWGRRGDGVAAYGDVVAAWYATRPSEHRGSRAA